MDSYFLLDTRTGRQADFKTYGEFGQAARLLKIQPNLVPIDSIYSKYRFTLFDAFTGILLIGPPLNGTALLTQRIVRVRSEPRS